MTPLDSISQLRERFGSSIGAATEFRDEHSVAVAGEAIVPVCQFLKQTCGYDMLTDLSGIDHYGETPRFEVGYILYGMTHHGRLRLKVRLPEEQPVVASVTGVWQTANWHEREAFDMFGIRFEGHPNLKRILMWPGYPHHPLRKDFPLAGLPADLPRTAVDAGRVEASPMAGGPFVSGADARSTTTREPRQYATGGARTDEAGRPHHQESV
jgi:NADH-quinone oxidoreductase subunit C